MGWFFFAFILKKKCDLHTKELDSLPVGECWELGLGQPHCSRGLRTRAGGAANPPVLQTPLWSDAQGVEMVELLHQIFFCSPLKDLGLIGVTEMLLVCLQNAS